MDNSFGEYNRWQQGVEQPGEQQPRVGRDPGMLSMLTFTPGMPGGRVSGSLACSSREPGAVLEVTGGEGLRRLYKAQPFMWTGAS